MCDIVNIVSLKKLEVPGTSQVLKNWTSFLDTLAANIVSYLVITDLKGTF